MSNIITAKLSYQGVFKILLIPETFEKFKTDICKLFGISEEKVKHLECKYSIGTDSNKMILTNDDTYEDLKKLGRSSQKIKIELLERQDQELSKINAEAEAESVCKQEEIIDINSMINLGNYEPDNGDCGLLSRDDYIKEMNAKVEDIVEKRLASIKKSILTEFTKNIQEKSELYYSNYEKSVISRSKINPMHMNKCGKCQVYPIMNICYKCSVCDNFFLCENCEDSVQHEHNLIKIRKAEPKFEQAFNSQAVSSSIVVSNKDLFSRCMTKDLRVTIDNTSGTRFNVKFLNSGQVPWPKGVMLCCLSHLSSMYGESVPIKIKVDAGKDINIEVKFTLFHSAGIYNSFWQLKTQSGDFFGELIKFEIHLKIDTNKAMTGQYYQENIVSYHPQKSVQGNFNYSQNGKKLQKSYNYIDLTDMSEDNVLGRNKSQQSSQMEMN